MVHTASIEVHTNGQGDAVDVTGAVADAVRRSRFRHGIATVFVVGSTAAVTTLEFEPGVVADLDRTLEQWAPRDGHYDHHLRWGDDNGSSHVRAALLGPSITVPFSGGQLALGTWQQVVVVELDTRPRDRRVIVQVMGEGQQE